MAGGEHARVVACWMCGERAERVYEGLEDDHYVCAAGHFFGIDWSYSGGPPSEPQWPKPELPRP
jgi:hypothetical protein